MFLDKMRGAQRTAIVSRQNERKVNKKAAKRCAREAVSTHNKEG